MKILLATYWYLPHVGGVSTYVDNMQRSLQSLGHSVDVLAHHPDMQHYYMPNNGRSLKKTKIKDVVYEKVLRFYDQQLPLVDDWIRWREIERYSYETAVTVFGLDYDLILTQDIVSTRALWRVKPNHVPLIATIHGCLALEYLVSGEVSGRGSLAWKYAAAEEYYGAVSSDATIVPTAWLKGVLTRDFGIAQDRLTVIPYGMDIDQFLRQVRRAPALHRPHGKKLIVCPARLVPVKGHKHLLDALGRLRTERGDWVCWLMGDGPERGALEQQSRSLGLQDHVVFLGGRNDVPSLLNQADIFVLPSVQDNHPFAVMEAQVLGKALVVSDAGGIPEMVAHGKTGLVAQAGSADELHSHLRHLLADDDHRRVLGRAARKWALDQWSVQTMIDRTLAVYARHVGDMR